MFEDENPIQRFNLDSGPPGLWRALEKLHIQSTGDAPRACSLAKKVSDTHEAANCSVANAPRFGVGGNRIMDGLELK